MNIYKAPKKVLRIDKHVRLSSYYTLVLVLLVRSSIRRYAAILLGLPQANTLIIDGQRE
jgi:hypothetical protein